jgi:hypothetical protein
MSAHRINISLADFLWNKLDSPPSFPALGVCSTCISTVQDRQGPVFPSVEDFLNKMDAKQTSPFEVVLERFAGLAALKTAGFVLQSDMAADSEAKKNEAAASSKKKEEPPKPVDPVTHGMNGVFRTHFLYSVDKSILPGYSLSSHCHMPFLSHIFRAHMCTIQMVRNFTHFGFFLCMNI